MAEGMPDFGKQIGPLPLGAWIAVVAGGLGIAYYSRNSGGGGGTTDTTDSGTVVDDTGTPDGVGDGSVGGWIPTTPGSGTGDAPITDNDSWGNAAINWLIAQGYDPAWSYSAITKALEGGRGSNRLSVREYALWRAALRHLGSPPVPVVIPPPTAVGKPKGGGGTHQTPPTKPTPKYAVVRITPGMTLKGLANRFYGNPSAWNRIFEANQVGRKRADGTPGILTSATKLPIGKRLIIPKGNG